MNMDEKKKNQSGRKKSRAVYVYIDKRLEPKLEYIKRTVGLGTFIEAMIAKQKVPPQWQSDFDKLARTIEREIAKMPVEEDSLRA